MGRQAYLNRLALGRSPYEAPERPAGPAADPDRSMQRRVSALHADGYVQHYDERGHPVNPESKVFGRELRRAKNDILSTMGIVVSEEGDAAGPSEQQKIERITAENDYGLIMATLDQISAFLGTWWTSSLTHRLQTFKSYTHIPLMAIISRERMSYGTLGFYFAGIPAWAMSTCLSIIRHQPLERLISSIQNRFSNNDMLSKVVRASFTLLHSATRGSLLVLAIQSYMYSLLQSLHLVHPLSLPGIQFLIPFGDFSLLQFPRLPTDLSVEALSGFLLSALRTPALVVYTYMYFRPLVELRIYRLIRRRLPKPRLADELSIKVAFENDLIDWMVPTLGRRADEENYRGTLSLFDDIIYELGFYRFLLLRCFGIKTQLAMTSSDTAANVHDDSQPLVPGVEQLQHERHPRAHPLQRQSAVPPAPEEVIRGRLPHIDGPGLPLSDRVLEQAIEFGEGQVLSNEENRISQSPAEMSAGDLSELAPPNAMPPVASPPSNSENIDPSAVASRRNSRSNTLFSRPSSPETSSPTSPRVRASLIHQNSDVITMQLELLGNRQPRHQGANQTENRTEQTDVNGESARRQSVSEILDNLLSNPGQNISTFIHSDAIDSDGLSNMTAGVSPADGTNGLTRLPQNELEMPLAERGAAVAPVEERPTSVGNILPDSIEEPSHDESRDQAPEGEAILENGIDSQLPPLERVDHNASDNIPDHLSTPHRVTILSCLPVDSLATHLASLATTVIFLPLESLYLRSLASSYLSSTRNPPVLRSDIIPMHAWAAGGSRSNVLAYMGKLILMVGMHAAVNASLWGIISGSAMRIGRRFCGWGTL
ncbi:hypothetical protein BDV59DRAFT_183364 [Aspergillus ambiguus]|uniref:uncharacterized protein n=1 Tax=Aspergillus ambiguus TaxID=176160 RepID=UPI003CCD04B0